MKLAGSRIEAVVGIYKRYIFNRHTVAVWLKQGPGIGFYVIDLLVRIPDRQVRHACSRIHIYEPVGYAGIGSAKRIACLGVVPPAFYRSVIIGRVFANTNFENGSENFPFV